MADDYTIALQLVPMTTLPESHLQMSCASRSSQMIAQNQRALGQRSISDNSGYLVPWEILAQQLSQAAIMRLKIIDQAPPGGSIHA